MCEFKIHTPHWIDSAHGAHVRSNIQTMYCSMISSMYAVWLYHYSSSKNQNYAQDGHHSNLISFLGCCFCPGSEVYYLTCAVKLPEDEDFPPAPLTTRGEAVAFEID